MNEICGHVIVRAVNSGLVPGEVIEYHWYPKSERAEVRLRHPETGEDIRVRTKDVRRAMRRACLDLGVGAAEMVQIHRATELGELELLSDRAVRDLMELAVFGRVAA